MMNRIMKTVLVCGVPLLSPAAPQFYLPLDGTADVVGPNGERCHAAQVSGSPRYVDGVNGRALEIRRYAYDQATTLNMNRLPEMECREGTVSFFFKPEWDGAAPGGHWLVYGYKPEQFRFYFIKPKNTGGLELSVCAPDQRQLIVKTPLKAGKWVHLAFSWSIPKGEVAVYVDGRPAGKRSEEKWKKPDFRLKTALNIWLGKAGSDRFKAEVGGGAYDDIRIYDRQLSDDEILAEAIGGRKQSLRKLPLNSVRRDGGRMETVFRFRTKRLSAPSPLLVLKSGKRTLTVTAMGTSGNLALNAGGKVLESPYVLDLTRPLKLTLEPEGGRMRVCFDDALQGSVELPDGWEGLTSVEVADGVTLDSAAQVPSAQDRTLLNVKTASPLERELWSLGDAERRTHGGVRRSVSLNGVWRMFRAESYSYAPLREARQLYSRVPGSPRSRHFHHYYEKDGRLTPSETPRRIDTAGWYQRSFTVPEEWKGMRIWLNFSNLHGNYGRVYLNGRLLDSFRQDFRALQVVPNARRIDVTDRLEKENVVTVFLDRSIVALWQIYPDRGDHHALALDDVWLESSPSPVALKNAVAFPSFRKKHLEMRARIRNPRGVKGDGVVEFRYRRQGERDKVFVKRFPLTGEPEQRVVFREGWNNPVLWDCENPELYTQSVSLTVNGKKADALPDADFGFREMWVENGEFRLNGRKTRLRMWAHPAVERTSVFYGSGRGMAAYVAHAKEMNYDTVRFNPLEKSSERGFVPYLRESDRQGLYNLFPMPPYEGEDMALYREWVERFLEHYGNHPSILMWYTDMNTCHYPWCQDPAKLTDIAYVPQKRVRARAFARVAETLMRSLDPSRELFQHAGGNSGKIFTSMNYQSMGTPLQEQEDWPKQWSESERKQPLMVVESNFTFQRQFEYFDGPVGRIMAAEHAARFFGDSVFARENRPVPYLSDGIFSAYAARNANYNAVCELMYRNVVRAWRAYDMSALGDFQHGYDLYQAFRSYGSMYNHRAVAKVDNRVKTAGAKPDRPGYTDQMTDFTRPEGLYHVMREAFRPLLVFLGGRADDFTSKDHAFFSGEKFEKSIVAVNDRTTPQKLRFRWEFRLEGKTVSQGEENATVSPGGILKHPIRLSAPEVAKRSEGKLLLEIYRNGTAYGTDELALQVFPKHVPPEFHNVSAGLYDPVGKTEAMLRKAGFPFRKVATPDDAGQCRLLIIGQEALGEHVPEFLQQLEREERVEHGLKILIFEQKQCNLGNLVFESPSYRNAFIRRPDSLYVRGLKDGDFSDWRGSADSVPAFVLSAEETPHYPRSKWKCGNGGIVAGNVIRKPSYGNFTTIVDCGFNLMFAALMELRKEHGQILFCQLDVTSRYGLDPVATRLVDNMLVEMSRPNLPLLAQSVVYLGDAEHEKQLRRMGMVYEKLSGEDPAEIGNRQVVILGRNPVPENRKAAFRKDFAAHRERAYIALPGAPLDLLPVKLKTAKRPVFRALVPKHDPLFAGIPDADLYFREAREMDVLDAPPEWTVTTSPALFGRYDFRTGAVIVMNLSPAQMEESFWMREKVSRVWNAIFNNMNIALGRELKLFSSPRMRHNTVTPLFAETVLKDGMLKLDGRNSGKVSDTVGFKPYKLGVCWEKQGFTQNNPYYRYPSGTPANMKKMYDGYAWIRVKVTIPEAWKRFTLRLAGGPVDDADWTYFNGVKIGETTLDKVPNAHAVKRNYRIPPELIRFGGENMLTIRVYDRWGAGGVTGPLKIVAEDPQVRDSWSPYVDKLNFYDVDAYHNW